MREESAWLRWALPSALAMLLEAGYLLLFLLLLLAVLFLLSRVLLCLLQQKDLPVRYAGQKLTSVGSALWQLVLCVGEGRSSAFPLSWVSTARCVSLKLKKTSLLLFLILSRNGNILFKKYSVTLRIKQVSDFEVFILEPDTFFHHHIPVSLSSCL